jgi:hypothetical protein
MTEKAFSVRSVPGLSKEDQLPIQNSLETAVRKGVWCEMAGVVESVVRSEKLVAEAGIVR